MIGIFGDPQVAVEVGGLFGAQPLTFALARTDLSTQNDRESEPREKTVTPMNLLTKFAVRFQKG
jgi:hypothetical protein